MMKDSGDMFILVHDFSISTKIDIVKAKITGGKRVSYTDATVLLPPDIPTISIDASVSDLKGCLNSKVYVKLLSLGDVFTTNTVNSSKRHTMMMNAEEYEKNHIEEVITEKKELLKKAIKVGFLFKRGKHIKKVSIRQTSLGRACLTWLLLS